MKVADDNFDTGHAYLKAMSGYRVSFKSVSYLKEVPNMTRIKFGSGICYV